MTDIDRRIPPSMVHWLETVPASASVAVLMRHSVRPALPPGETGYSLSITEVGKALACELGALIGGRLRTLHTSPVPRCVQTAEALRTGAGSEMPITQDRLLGAPGIFVIDEKLAWRNWEEQGHEWVMEHIASQKEPLPGMAEPDLAARRLVRHLLTAADDRSGIHVFATHDSLVLATVARLLHAPSGRDSWPGYLEGAFFWQEKGRLIAAYRDRIVKLKSTWTSQLN